MKRYFKYDNSGGIQSVIDRVIDCNSGYYESLIDLLQSCTRKGITNLRIVFYGYDKRLQKQVYMVTGNHSGFKNQFVSYFIEV